jgi:hypothetical protein
VIVPSYCQIYCQKRGGEGIPGDGEVRIFSNLLISISAFEGSNPTLSATFSRLNGLLSSPFPTAKFHTG